LTVVVIPEHIHIDRLLNVLISKYQLVYYSPLDFMEYSMGHDRLYDSGNRLFGNIHKSLGKGSQQNNDDNEKDSENRCGQPEIER
jgi:hypothetical protein